MNKEERIDVNRNWLINLLKEETMKARIKNAAKEIILNPPTLEERIERQERMLEKSLPAFLKEGVLRNLINLTAKKIKRDYCE